MAAKKQPKTDKKPRVKLSQEVVQQYYQHISEGKSDGAFADIIGVSHNTIKSWKNKGERDLAEGKKTLYAGFVSNYDALVQSMRKKALNALDRHLTDSRPHPSLIQFSLTKLDKQNFGDEEQKVNVNIGEKVVVNDYSIDEWVKRNTSQE